MARPVGQRDEGVTPVGGVQVGSADPGRERADEGFVGAGGGDIGLFDRDPAGVDDNASHAGQGDFLPLVGGTWPA